jgi:hypothetical protein
MQEISLTNRLPADLVWAKLLSRCQFCLSPLQKPAPDRKRTPMNRLSCSLFLALIGLACLCFNANAIIVQKLQNEVTGTRNRDSLAISGTTLENNTEQSTIFSVYWTAACSGPCAFVNHHFSTTLGINRVSVGGYVSPRGQWLNRSQRESGKCDGASIFWANVVDEQGIDSRWNSNSFANSQVQDFVGLAIAENGPANIKINGISLPSALGNVYSPNTRDWLLRINNGQTFDYMSSRDESAFTVNEESSSIDQLNGELPLIIKFSAENGNDSVLYALNGQNESLGSTTSGGSRKSRKAKKKTDNDTASKSSNDSHSSGVLLIANDGKAIGCNTTHRTSTIAISCPDVDPVSLETEAPQSPKHDPSSPPPSRE